MARPRLAPPAPPPEHNSRFLNSGSHLLNKVLGGGWAFGRVANIVGDKSSGKTLLAIEAIANFHQRAPIENIRYVEAEAAFDVAYAQSLGLPSGLAMTQDIRTVEQFFDDISKFLEKMKKSKAPALYILDSLDALSDDAEAARAIDDGSYGATKAKKLSETFRRITADIEESNCALFIISQIRDKLNVRFGETKTRSGGRALDFYASQIVWLAELGKIPKTVGGIKRDIGVKVKARTKKNKVGMPYRDCEVEIIFGYGVDDEISMATWLEENKAIDAATAKAIKKQVEELRKARNREGLYSLSLELRETVDERWAQIEAAIAPPMSKYQGPV